VVDDLLGLRALRLGQCQLLDDSCRGSDASLAGHDDQCVALHKILWNPPAVHRHQAEHVLSLGKSLHGGPGEPSRGFRIIGPHAFTVHIGEAEKMLGDLKSLVCGLAVPCDRLGRIARHTPSIGVHESDVELGARIAPLGKGRQPLKRGRVLAPVGRGDRIVELRCRRRTNEAENQDEECESCVDHGCPLRPASIMMDPPDDTIKTATV
jgi:hypothetical protein